MSLDGLGEGQPQSGLTSSGLCVLCQTVLPQTVDSISGMEGRGLEEGGATVLLHRVTGELVFSVLKQC